MEYKGVEESMSRATTPTPPDSSQITPKSSPKGSPKSRVKFLCSHGGKILPRPSDGHLKYVGGETRVISVSRDTSFYSLMKKLTYQMEGEMILKYKLMPEDLDALVSVKSDEDLRHMFEEYDRHETLNAPRLRTFLFPANPNIIDPMEPQAIEQRYLDAINGIERPTTTYTTINGNHGYKPCTTANQNPYFMSSPCSAPRSPDSCANEASTTPEALLQLQMYQNTRISHNINKVQSSPNLYNLNPQQQLPPPGNHQVQQQQQQQQQHHYYQSYKQLPNQHHHSYQSNKPPLDPHPHKSGGGITDKYRSAGKQLSPIYHHADQASQYYCPIPKHGKGCCSPTRGFCNKCRLYDEYSPSNDRSVYKTESLPPTPPPVQSPNQAGCLPNVKVWENGI